MNKLFSLNREKHNNSLLNRSEKTKKNTRSLDVCITIKKQKTTKIKNKSEEQKTSSSTKVHMCRNK